MSLTPSTKCLDLVKSFEGFSANAYRCPANIPTIGWGTTSYPDGSRVKMGDTCTREQADEYLMHEISQDATFIDRCVKVGLNQNQFDALASFIYNVGVGAFASSTMLKKINAEDFAGAADQFLKWTHGGGRELPGLVRRREAERELFMEEAV